METFGIIQFRFNGWESSKLIDKMKMYKIKTFMDSCLEEEIEFEYDDEEYTATFDELLNVECFENFINDPLKPSYFKGLYESEEHNSNPEIKLVELVEKIYLESKKKNPIVQKKIGQEWIVPIKIEDKKTFCVKKHPIYNIYINKEHSLIFDPVKKIVTGKLVDDFVFLLSEEDILICKSYHVNYIVMFNMLYEGGLYIDVYEKLYKEMNPSPIDITEEDEVEEKGEYPPPREEKFPIRSFQNNDEDSNLIRKPPSHKNTNDLSVDIFTPTTTEILNIFAKFYSTHKGLETDSLISFTDEHLEAIVYSITGHPETSEFKRENLIRTIKEQFISSTGKKNVILECSHVRDFKISNSDGITYEDILEGCRVFIHGTKSRISRFKETSNGWIIC